jgi:phage virion morphogenesis protein
MADPIDITIDSAAVQAVLRNLESAVRNMGPVFRLIKTTLVSETEKRFAEEGPGWPKSQAAEDRGGMTLQDSGQLAGSVSGESADHSATVGAGKVYAAIHQLGGDAGRGHAVHLPPRPYLPIDEGGSLFPAAEQAVLGDLMEQGDPRVCGGAPSSDTFPVRRPGRSPRVRGSRP